MSFIKRYSKGFTLLELLIVIALLGALFIGLLATLDPLEQIKKGGDTARRNITAELYGSSINYYAVRNGYPWTSDITGMAGSDTLMTSSPNGYISQIVSSGELKNDFITLAGSGNLSKLFLTSTADANGLRQNLTICFLPESKAFGRDVNAQYGKMGAVSSGCLSTGGGSPCYFCVK